MQHWHSKSTIWYSASYPTVRWLSAFCCSCQLVQQQLTPSVLQCTWTIPQVLESGPSQLAAAVVALVSTLVARAKDSSGLLWLTWQASFAHWALEACVIAEAERLTGAKATRHRPSNPYLVHEGEDLEQQQSVVVLEQTHLVHCVSVMLQLVQCADHVLYQFRCWPSCSERG